MNEQPFVPGPYDEYRGMIEIDCYECLSPEWKARFRIGNFLPPPYTEGDEFIQEIDFMDYPDDD